MAEHGAAETGAGAASVPGVTGCGGLVLAGLCRDPQSVERLNPRVKPCREREGQAMMLQGMRVCVRVHAHQPWVRKGCQDAAVLPGAVRVLVLPSPTGTPSLSNPF